MKKVIIIAVTLLSLGFLFNACSSNNANNSNEQSTLLAKDSVYTCEMHQDVISDHPGDCPKCGMHLVKQKPTPDQEK
jgi:hypothetical protein